MLIVATFRCSRSCALVLRGHRSQHRRTRRLSARRGGSCEGSRAHRIVPAYRCGPHRTQADEPVEFIRRPQDGSEGPGRPAVQSGKEHDQAACRLPQGVKNVEPSLSFRRRSAWEPTMVPKATRFGGAQRRSLSHRTSSVRIQRDLLVVRPTFTVEVVGSNRAWLIRQRSGVDAGPGRAWPAAPVGPLPSRSPLTTTPTSVAASTLRPAVSLRPLRQRSRQSAGRASRASHLERPVLRRATTHPRRPHRWRLL